MGAESLPPSSWTTPNGNQRKITLSVQSQSCGGYDVLNALRQSEENHAALSSQVLLYSGAQRLTASVVSSQALYLDHYNCHVKLLNAQRRSEATTV